MVNQLIITETGVIEMLKGFNCGGYAGIFVNETIIFANGTIR